MLRPLPLRPTRTPASCALVVALLATAGCDVERPLRSTKPLAPSITSHSTASLLPQAQPQTALQPLGPESYREVTTTSHVHRMPPPPAFDQLPTPLLELLPPIDEQELAGEPLEPIEPQATPQPADDVPAAGASKVDVSNIGVPTGDAPEDGSPLAIATAESPAIEQAATMIQKPTSENADVGHATDEAGPRIAPLPSPGRAFEVSEFDHAAQMAASTTMDEVLAYFPAENELSRQFQPRVQEAFTLARHGALHAARARFEQLMLELAQAKDASKMTNRHSRSLAAGLRALEEADDFLATSAGEATPQSIATGHQTPMLHETDTEWTLPHEAIAMYHLYAQQKLAAAVAGEQAGSMMLFGMGKIYSQLAVRDDMPQAIRKSLSMYRSAVVAHNQNHLAANEAGVLLARAGRYAQAAPLLHQAVQLADASVTHRNLAYVHTKLNEPQLAALHRHAAEQVARREMAQGQLSAERGIAWVSPQDFNRQSRRPASATVASRPPSVAQAPVQQPRMQNQPAPTPTAQRHNPNTPPARPNWW